MRQSQSSAATSVAEVSALAQIYQLRQAKTYQDAETTRRSIGAETMALFPQSAMEYGQIRLLINTWETIATIAEAFGLPWERFYKSNPICHMWLELSPAIKEIRKTTPGYADTFQRLYRTHGRWLKQQPKKYQSAACQGMNASFG